MKQELINRISSCCLLPFSLMMTWIDSLIFPNDVGVFPQKPFRSR